MVRRNVYCAVQHIWRNEFMADETTVEATAAAEAPAKVADAVAETAEAVVKQAAKAEKRARASTARRVKREASPKKTASKTYARRAKTVRRNTRNTARKSAAAQKRIETVTKTNTYFPGFDAVPAFAPLQSIFADA